MSKATNKTKQQAKTKRKPKATKQTRRRNPSAGPASRGLFDPDPWLLVAMGLFLIAAPAFLGIDLSKPLLRRCHHPEPVPCPRGEDGKFCNPECLHYGHVEGMCHECFCVNRQQDTSICHSCVGPYGESCPPDCKNFGNRFDGCHRRDCLKLCGEKVQ